MAAWSTLIRVSTFSWPTPRRGSALVCSTSSADRAPAVADHMCGHPLGDRGDRAVDDEAAVVPPGDEGLDDDQPAARLGLGDVEGPAYVVVAAQVEHHPAAVVAVQRLEHHRIADPVGQPDRVVDRTHRLRARHRQSGRRQQVERQLLVAGDVDRDRGGLRRHRRPDPLLMHSLAELDQGGRVQPEVGDVPAHRLLDDGLGGRAERGPLAPHDEPFELGLEVEVRIRPNQVVDQLDRELAGRQTDRLVVVGVDHVVAAALALHLAGLAAPHVVADRLLQLQSDMLGDMAQPGALVQPLDEPAPPPAAAAVVGQPGQPLDQGVGESWQLVGREVLQHSEVHDELNGGLVMPDVRAAVNPAREDFQVGLGGHLHCLAPETLDASDLCIRIAA